MTVERGRPGTAERSSDAAPMHPGYGGTAKAARRCRMTIVVDYTHVGRRSSGIERVTRALLSPAALAPAFR